MSRPIKMTAKTVDDVIDALGGTHVAAQLFGVTDAAVANWRQRGLPPRRFLTIGVCWRRTALRRRHRCGACSRPQNEARMA